MTRRARDLTRRHRARLAESTRLLAAADVALARSEVLIAKVRRELAR